MLDIISTVLPRAQRVMLGCLDDLDVFTTNLNEIDALGSLPTTLSTMTMAFADKMLNASGAGVAIRRLACLLAKSSVLCMSFSFDISIYSHEWNKPAMLLGNAYGEEDVVVALLLTSLVLAKVSNLVTLDVTGANFDEVGVMNAIIAALSATLTTLRDCQQVPSLQSLYIEPKIIFEREKLTVLAQDAIPELRGLARLNTLAHVAWDLTAEVDSFLTALADAVPNLFVLDLSRNQKLGDGIVDQLVPSSNTATSGVWS
ncbi:hypothetical protein AMAG_16766 [Allomyces macrogynus ATCC 38327]|uniref:Uncharacterized protein n=1 Tax=Allomyces macrogynus (strain ATCC 38327) TaxID=578462 RepID=A0A0L0TBZ6_ALLM3|nr:hypothetical protein AMAG_16766 [Allomyces macrogynus ATCC 38327]|eukprot:KNE72277.1 hypothetical protein AMAG_16766 [Allomyces macrogynus ATCC 38327]